MLSVVLFFGMIVIGLWLAFAKHPAFAFVTYQLIYFMNPASKWWGNLIPEIGYSFAVVVIMILLVLRRDGPAGLFKAFEAPALRWAYLLMLLYGLAWFYAIDVDNHYDAWYNFLKLVVIVSLAYCLVDGERALGWVINGYIAGAWYMSFYIFQMGRNSGARVERMGPVDSPDANGMAAALVPSLILALNGYMSAAKTWQKLLYAFAGVFIANALVLINSRAAFLAVVVSVGYFLWVRFFSKFRAKGARKQVVFVVVAGLAGGVYLADDGFIERMLTIKEESSVVEEKETGATRIVFWTAAWDMAKDHPFGSGYRGFNFRAPQYIPEGVDTGGKVTRSVHSTWFEALSEVGYPGLLALCMMLYASFKASLATRRQLVACGDYEAYYQVVAALAALGAFMVAMTFINRLRAEILYWCVMFVFLYFKVYCMRREKEQAGVVRGLND